MDQHMELMFESTKVSFSLSRQDQIKHALQTFTKSAMQQFTEVTEEKLVCLEINPILKSLKYLILLKKKKKKRKGKKTLHGDYNQRSVMFNLQGDLFLFPILYFPPFHSFMSP